VLYVQFLLSSSRPDSQADESAPDQTEPDRIVKRKRSTFLSRDLDHEAF
jgi:hypothetical protein